MKLLILTALMIFGSNAYAENKNILDYAQKMFENRGSRSKKKAYSLITKPGGKSGNFKMYCWLPNGEPNSAFSNLDVSVYAVSFTTYDVKLTNGKLMTVPIDHCYFKEQ